MNKDKDFPIVDLISAPENALKIIYTACKVCYSADYPIKIWNSMNKCYFLNHGDCCGCSADKDCAYQKMLKLVNKVLESGHHSTIEHIQFVFSISGVSRACTHQLVRHRHMSFCQKSQRFVAEKGQFEYVVPPSYQREYYESITIKHKGAYYDYNDVMELIQAFYSKSIEAGIPAEDARFVLPNAATSSMIASLNLRELIHLANLRLCTNSQWEIRAVVQKMCDLVIQKEPWLKDYLVPQCVKNGHCSEINKCGRF